MRWLSCLLLAPLLASAEPLSLTHQTRIVGPLGNPIEGEHRVELSFWTVDAGGTEANDQLWVATFPAVMLNEGYASFRLELSDGGDAIDSGWFNSDVWLQVSVDDTPLLPRAKMTDVPGASLGVASTSATRPAQPAQGQIWFNAVTNELEVYVGSTWQRVVAESKTYASCAELKAAGRTGNGYYDIDPDGSTGPIAPISAWCDMNTADGGWTRVFVAETDNYGSTSIPYIAGLSGSNSVVSRSSEMMFAYTNPSDGSLTNAWTFATPTSVHSVTPMAVGQCVYQEGSFTRVSDNTTYNNYTMRMGWGSFGSTCDDSCSSTWGHICLKSNTSYPGGGGGFSDFPFFATFAYSGTDHCSQSNQGYTTTSCTSTRRFTILVR